MSRSRFSSKKYIMSVLLLAVSISSLLILTMSINTAYSAPDIDYSAIENSIVLNENPVDDSDWYDDKIEYIIITRDQTAEVAAMQVLADWKTKMGVPTRVVNQSEFMTYSGKDIPEKIRNCIKYYYDNYGIEWVLLAGDEELIPTRYVYNPDTVIVDGQSEYGSASESSKPTDYYYAELTGNWDQDNDGKYGESLLYAENDEIDWETEVYVGRFPGDDANELATMVNKTIYYENITKTGTWMDRVLLAGAIQKDISTSDPDGEEETYLVNQIIEESLHGRSDYNKLIETNFPSQMGGTNLTWTTFNEWSTAGNSIVFYAGHGAPNSYDKLGSYSDFFYGSDAANLMNNEKFGLWYGDACSVGFFDGVDSLGEKLLLNERGGAIGFVGTTRVSWFMRDDTYGPRDDQKLCELNRGMARLFFQEMFLNGNYQQGKALYEMKKSYLNSWWMQDNPFDGQEDPMTGEITIYNIHQTEWERKNVLTYILFGDPELDVYTAQPKNFDQDQSYGGDTGIFVEETYYAGEYLNLVLQDEDGASVSDATVCIMGEDGAYRTFKSGATGHVQIYLPHVVQDYNFTVSAHNMITLHGGFSTILDGIKPRFSSELIYSPENPSVEDNLMCSVNATDDESGVGSGYFVLSQDQFSTYDYYAFSSTITNRDKLTGVLPKLDSGTYEYITFIFDNAGNSNYTVWNSSNKFSVPVPNIMILALIGNIGLASVVLGFGFKNKNIKEEYARKLDAIDRNL